jgi:hypothetical protein
MKPDPNPRDSIHRDMAQIKWMLAIIIALLLGLYALLLLAWVPLMLGFG